MSTYTTTHSISGLGLPRTDTRKQRRTTRKAASGRAGRRFLGIFTLGIGTAATAKTTRESGQANIIARSAAASSTPTQDIALQSTLSNTSAGAAPPADVIGAALSTSTTLDDALRASGITPDPDTASENVLVDLRSGSAGGSLIQETARQQPVLYAECECLVRKAAASQGLTLTDAMLDAGLTACFGDLNAFRADVAATGQNTDSCRPWYMRRTTWVLGAAVVAGAVIIKRKK